MEEIVACITKPKALEVVSSLLNKELNEGGFKYLNSKAIFLKKTPFGFNKISILLTSKWPVYLSIDIIYGIRFNKIETAKERFLDNRFGNYTSAQIKGRTTHSFIVNFVNEREKFYKPYWDEYVHPGDKGFIVKDEADIILIMNDLRDSIIKSGFGYFETHKTIESIVEDEIKIYHKFNDEILLEKSAISILIILKLANDKRFYYYKEIIINHLIRKNVSYPNRIDTLPKIRAVYECIEYLEKLNN